ncbi:MAG TPA: hypothetical protein VF260_08540 [Bacilli bacterium]
MNVFEKLKLRSQLKNCDFRLAGTVIKQQYYQKNGESELNRLIDDLLSNPCFDTAIKLIEYDYLMTFYFTESKNGGLYIQKKGQLDNMSAENDEENTQPAHSTEFPADKVPEPELLNEIKVSRWVMPTAGRKSEEVFRREDFYSPESPPNPVLIDEETAPLPRVKFKDNLPFSARSVFPQKQEKQAKTKAEPDWESVSLEEKKEEVLYPAEMEKPGEEVAESGLEIKKAKADDVFRPTGNNAVTFRYAETEHPANGQAFDLHAVIPEKTAFPNVLATLKIDINEMKKQISIYNKRIADDHPESAKYKGWVKSLEKALDEFTDAVRILHEIKK